MTLLGVSSLALLANGSVTTATQLLAWPLNRSHQPLRTSHSAPAFHGAHNPPLPAGDLLCSQQEASKASLADIYLFAMNGACISWVGLLKRKQKGNVLDRTRGQVIS